MSAEASLAENDQLDAPNVLVISYRVDTRENLQEYFEKHAARLREEGTLRSVAAL